MATRRWSSKEDADTVGFVLWQHLLGAPCFRAGFCSKTIIPDSEEHPDGFFKDCPQGRPSVDSGLDVVSKTNIAEVDNAINGIAREVKQRFDLQGRMCSIERAGNTLTITADNDMLLRQMHDLLYTYCARRGVDRRFLDFKSPQNATKGSLRQEVLIRQGIDQALGKQIIKMIKGSKLKVQVAIQGDELRISGKKRDDLQLTIESIKEMEITPPLQYINFRD